MTDKLILTKEQREQLIERLEHGVLSQSSIAMLQSLPMVSSEPVGMTIRDYFAATAMQSMCDDEVGRYNTFASVARDAYKMADSMLEARAV